MEQTDFTTHHVCCLVWGRSRDSVDHDLRLKADHSPRLALWMARLSGSTELNEVSKSVVQREQFVIY
jgi:hypothetical protein